MQMTATQVASIYGISPERVGGKRGDSLTYDTQEQEQISLVSDTLDPWLVRWESSLYGLLPERQYVRFNRNARIRTDIKTRYEVHKIARDIGLNNVNELRDVEDMELLPKAGPDEYDGTDYTPLQVLVAMARYQATKTPEQTSHDPDLEDYTALPTAMPSQKPAPTAQNEPAHSAPTATAQQSTSKER